VLRPVIVAINAVAAGILKLFGVKLMDEVSSTYTREEVAARVEESRGEGLIEPEEYNRLAGALGFTEKPVSTVLMPPETLTTVRRGSTAADVEALCAATGYSRFPVQGEDGELLGYLHIKDVLEVDEKRRQRVVEDKWTRPFATVTDGDLLHDALETLQRRGAHMARVVDQEGTTLGLATLEDVIEELVGEIRDAAHLDDTPSTAS
jgi:CBS domain containing-hemolysin-like protein